jgi:hypothetical protein
MVRGILFKDKRFDANDDNNLMSCMTENTIILCANYKLMRSLAEEIFNTINGNAEYNDYDCDEEDVGKAKYELNFGLQKVIDINGQKIILCLEPSMIYKAKHIRDIWFADWIGKDDDYLESIYPMTIFKGSNEVWDSGLDEVYKMVVGGRYGCYDGSWITLISK